MTTPYPITVVTIFPEMIRQAVGWSITGRAIAAGLLEVRTIQVRDFATDRHRTVDDVPYGGGPGMVMKPEPLAAAIRTAREAQPGGQVVLLSASGTTFCQEKAQRYAADPAGVILVCGHYEGVDERIAEHYVDEEVSIGDYVLSGGEPAALVVLDAVARLVPGVLGNEGSLAEESHEHGLLEHPLYRTRFPGQSFVPDDATIDRRASSDVNCRPGDRVRYTVKR